MFVGNNDGEEEEEVFSDFGLWYPGLLYHSSFLTRLCYRKETFKSFKGSFFKDNEDITDFLARSGFYLDHISKTVNCCMNCRSSYNIYALINTIKRGREQQNEDDDDEEDYSMYFQHSTQCTYSKPNARSKVFYLPMQSLYFESERLNSFIEFPGGHSSSPITINNLAECGFYYLRKSDYIACRFCGKCYKNWYETDYNSLYDFNHPCNNSEKRHNISIEMSNLLEDIKLDRSHFYPLVHNNCMSQEIENEDVNYLAQMSVWKFKTPKYPQYESERARKETFNSFNWPNVRLLNLSPKELANAGFFYQGNYNIYNNNNNNNNNLK